MNDIPATLALSALGHLYLDTRTNAPETVSPALLKKLQPLFTENAIAGLLDLGVREFPDPLPPSFGFWQSFSRLFVTHVCKFSGQTPIPLPDTSILKNVINSAPFMTGGEYLNEDVLNTLWLALSERLIIELSSFDGSLQAYMSHHHAKWNLLGRVCFHLAENKNNPEQPFAFLATYTSHLSHDAKVQHIPLQRALTEYAGKQNKSALLALLLPIQKAAAENVFIKTLVETGQIYNPQAWEPKEAHQFLKAIPLLESAGITIRVPDWWTPKQPPRPRIEVTLGKEKAGQLGMNALLDFDMQFVLSSGEKLTKAEWETLLKSTETLVKVKGQWIEMDREKLDTVLSHWKKLERQVKNGGLSFSEGLRLLAGISGSPSNNPLPVETAEWSAVTAGDWLKEILSTLQDPNNNQINTNTALLEKHLHASLRPYQQVGVNWLWFLYQLKLGGCLADDMGLGKTIQVLSLLLLIKHQQSQKTPHLLVVPASLLGNWQAEIDRFAPGLSIWIAHPSNDRGTAAKKDEITQTHLASYDLIITTYSLVPRSKWINEIEWDLIVLDEAQMIKNPGAKQTQAIKALKSRVRLALTGTPIENRLSDLWSLFDFTSPGLLGSSKIFSDYSKKSVKKDDASNNNRFMSAIRTLTRPYILRRLKSDKRIIKDLPDKTELQSFCTLSPEQISLYQQAVTELAQRLETAEGIQRRGLVLSYLVRLKQICNHPTQWLGYGDYSENLSGKFTRLKDICEEIAAKQEKVLVFTQFREIIPALESYLLTIFGQPGLTLHGSTAIKKRAQLVEQFQQEQGPPFFILSLKAGGTGLNLTRAAHVIHFDRWWNPAVENQATDRAYRIGQKKNVLVHKFICRGTIEEKIDALITQKKTLSDELLSDGQEVLLTELNNSELLNMVSLDIHRALGDV